MYFISIFTIKYFCSKITNIFTITILTIKPHPLSKIMWSYCTLIRNMDFSSQLKKIFRCFVLNLLKWQKRTKFIKTHLISISWTYRCRAKGRAAASWRRRVESFSPPTYKARCRSASFAHFTDMATSATVWIKNILY